MMNSHLPGDAPAPDADGKKTVPAAGIRPGRRLIAVMLLGAAALDLTRCGLVLVTARHARPAAGFAAAGLAAAALSLWTARGCQGSRRWSGWAALLIGAASAPQAAASGFHAPFTAPDTATAALGILLTVAVLATAGRTGQPGLSTENPCIIGSERPDDPQRTPVGAPAVAAGAENISETRLLRVNQRTDRKRRSGHGDIAAGGTELAAARTSGSRGRAARRHRGDPS